VATEPFRCRRNTRLGIARPSGDLDAERAAKPGARELERARPRCISKDGGQDMGIAGGVEHRAAGLIANGRVRTKLTQFGLVTQRP